MLAVIHRLRKSCEMAASMRPFHIYLIDDHPIVGAGMKLAVMQTRAFAWAGSSSSLAEASEVLAGNPPDVLVLDLVIGKAVATESVTVCRQLLPDSVIAVFSSMPSHLYERLCIEAGADIYFGKEIAPADVLAGSLRILENGKVERDHTYSSTHAATNLKLTNEFTAIGLSPREAELVPLFAAGRSPEDIAAEVGRSPKTIAAQRDAIRVKLGCRSTREMTALLASACRLPGSS
jgi:DNA-binding NarL/FixJ family response regulator